MNRNTPNMWLEVGFLIGFVLLCLFALVVAVNYWWGTVVKQQDSESSMHQQYQQASQIANRLAEESQKARQRLADKAAIDLQLIEERVEDKQDLATSDSEDPQPSLTKSPARGAQIGSPVLAEPGPMQTAEAATASIPPAPEAAVVEPDLLLHAEPKAVQQALLAAANRLVMRTAVVEIPSGWALDYHGRRVVEGTQLNLNLPAGKLPAIVTRIRPDSLTLAAGETSVTVPQ
jgi:hypothetical protein